MKVKYLVYYKDKVNKKGVIPLMVAIKTYRKEASVSFTYKSLNELRDILFENLKLSNEGFTFINYYLENIYQTYNNVSWEVFEKESRICLNIFEWVEEVEEEK